MSEPFQDRAYELDAYPWNMGMIPRTLRVDGEERRHPALTSAVFVVHGIGQQGWVSTSAKLRAGFEDALVAIRDWQERSRPEGAPVDPLEVPAPFVMDGHWSDYADLEATFP